MAWIGRTSRVVAVAAGALALATTAAVPAWAGGGRHSPEPVHVSFHEDPDDEPSGGRDGDDAARGGDRTGGDESGGDESGGGGSGGDDDGPVSPGPTPPEPSGGVLIGASVVPHGSRGSAAEELAFLESEVGPLEIRRVFDPGFNRDFTDLAGSDVGRRATHYSFKPDMSALASGSLDGDIRAFLGTIPDGHRTILTVWHEPEDNFASSGDKKTYREAWRRFARLVDEQGRSELSTSWVMMAYSFRAMSGRDPLDWWPGSGVVDSIGIDVYNEGSLQGGRWDSPGRDLGYPAPGEEQSQGGYVHGGPIAFARSQGLPWGVAEFGSLENTSRAGASWTTAATKADWIVEAVSFYVSKGAAYIEYFHAGPHRGPWWLDSSTGALRAYEAMISRY